MYKKVFFIDLFLIIILFFSINSIVPYGLEKFLGPSTEKQISYSFKSIKNGKYTSIILGNSRMYRGINPGKINFAHTYNFAHDNDSFNQMYYKLIYTNNNFKINYLIMGLDYFQFSFLANSRNHIYKKYFPVEYLKDFTSTTSNVEDYFLKQSQKVISFMNVVIKSLFVRNAKAEYILEKNGWYHENINKKASEKEKLKRRYNILKTQDEYFFKILEYCKQNNIIVFLIIPPTRKEELSNYPKNIITMYEKKFKKVQNENIYYLNYENLLNSDINYFEDATHLNTKGANIFSEILNKDITKIEEQYKR